MATDVGSARVTVTGDVRNFAKQTEAELNAALARIRVDPVKVSVEIDNSDVAKTLVEARAAGKAIGKALNDTADDSGKSFSKRLEESGKSALKIFSKVVSGAGSALGPVAGALGVALGGTLVAAIAAVIVPGLAAAITAAAGLGLGAGLLGLGAYALKDVKALQKAVSSLGDTLSEVGRRAAQPLLKPLISALGAIQKLAKGLAPDFHAIFAALAPVIPMLTSGLGGFLSNVVDGLRDAMPGIVSVFQGFAAALPAVGQALGDFFRTIFSNKDVLNNTTEALTMLITGPLKLLGPAISGLTVIFGAWNNLLKLTADSWQPIKDALVSFVDSGTGAIGRLKEAWGPLGDAIQKVWDKLKIFAGEDTKSKLSSDFAALVQAIKDAWGPLKDFLGQVWDEAWGIIKKRWNDDVVPWFNETVKPWLRDKLKEIFEAAWNIAVQKTNEKINELKASTIAKLRQLPGLVGSAIASIPGVIGGVFQRAAGATISVVANLVAGAVNKLKQLPGQVGSALSGVRGRITGAFSGAGSWLVSAGAKIISGLIDGIQSGFQRVRNTLSSLTSLLPGWKGPAAVDEKILRESGRLVMKGFEAGLMDQRRSIQETLAGITGDLPSFTAGAARGGDGAAAASLSIAKIEVNVYGASGKAAGEEAAERILERLADAQTVR